MDLMGGGMTVFVAGLAVRKWSESEKKKEPVKEVTCKNIG